MLSNLNGSESPVNRIESCFAHLRQIRRKALIPFLVAGDPDLAATRDLALALLQNGADLLEIGVPFSDPSAEGPVIMAADARALAGGVRLAQVFGLVRELRRETQAPLLLLLYFNIIFRQGVRSFFDQCREAGVDGVIIPDLPLEEQDDAAPAAHAANVLLIRMVTPLSGSRLHDLTDQARGFLYCVSALGVTGERNTYQTDLHAYSRQLAASSGLPRALGFGISTPDQVKSLAPDWDALIVGSAIVRRIAEGTAEGLSGRELCGRLAEYCRSLRQALDGGEDHSENKNERPRATRGRLAPCLPSAEDFRRLAGNHALIPVCRRMTADTVTPISLFRRFDDRQSAWLLESVLNGDRWARYSIMGRRPLLRLSCRGSKVRLDYGAAGVRDFTATGRRENDIHEETSSEAGKNGGANDPVGTIRALLERYALPPELCGQGFRCGLVGYFAYDFIRCLERLPDNNPDELNLPDCDLMAPGEVVLYDHLKSELTLICNVLTGGDPAGAYRQAQKSLDDLENDLFGQPPVAEDPPKPTDPAEPVYSANPAGKYDFQPGLNREIYTGQVRQAKKYIRQGDIFQVVLSQRFSAAYTRDPFAVYRALRHVNPSPYLFYLRCPEAVLVGASPEMLVRLTGRMIETCPIAGTRRRGANPNLDDALAADLLADAKELAEHAMLVDLARNDVGRISRFGTVKVKDFCHVERFSHVMHLVSLVEGQLREDRFAIDVLASLLPAGTLSGAPKIRAMEIIDELEKVRRGPYGGAVGYLGFDGCLETCITIRTAVLKDNRIYIQAGAGIVADSVPETEYEETVSKAAALFSAIGEAGGFQ